MHPVLFHFGAIVIPSYGVCVAIGVLAALFLAQRTARLGGLDPARIWTLCVVALFSSLVAQRLLLLVFNMREISRHPAWLLTLAVLHSPLLTAAGAFAGLAAALFCAFRFHLPLRSTADVLAAPVALGFAFDQFGALLAGSGFGTETSVPWAVTYTHPFASLWSGAPLGTPVHPVQAYAAVAFLVLALALLSLQPLTRRPGDLAGLWFLGAGSAVYTTEIWRDTEGRGVFLNGAVDGPQLGAILLVLVGASLLAEWKRPLPPEVAHG